MSISIIVALLYNSMLYGIFPNQPGVSWESHFMGALAGACCAYYYKDHYREYLPKQYFTGADVDLEGYVNMENNLFKYTYKDGNNQQEEDSVSDK